jgi:hypothetical protein
MVWPFHRETRDKPSAISSISISIGDGDKISSFLPDNILCHARWFLSFKPLIITPSEKNNLFKFCKNFVSFNIYYIY